jgi:hypothetical protein
MFDPVKSFPIISSPALALFFLHPSLTPGGEKKLSGKTKTEPHLLLVGGKKRDRSRKKTEKRFCQDLLRS